MFRVIVAGSREFKDYQLLEKTLDDFLQDQEEPIRILCGMAHGADELGLLYAHWQIQQGVKENIKIHKRICMNARRQ